MERDARPYVPGDLQGSPRPAALLVFDMQVGHTDRRRCYLSVLA